MELLHRTWLPSSSRKPLAGATPWLAQGLPLAGAVDGVVAIGRHFFVAGATVDRVASPVACRDGVVAAAAGDLVLPGAGGDRVVAIPAIDLVGAGVAVQPVAAG